MRRVAGDADGTRGRPTRNYGRPDMGPSGGKHRDHRGEMDLHTHTRTFVDSRFSRVDVYLSQPEECNQKGDRPLGVALLPITCGAFEDKKTQTKKITDISVRRQ